MSSKHVANFELKTLKSLTICLIILAIIILPDLVRLVITFKHAIEVTETKVETEKPVALNYIPQFVLISYDGSRSVQTWKNILEFENLMKSQNKPLQSTFFINTAYFLTSDTKILLFKVITLFRQSVRRSQYDSPASLHSGGDG